MITEIKASGKSMFPLVSSGDLIKVDNQFGFFDLKIGDIAVFFSNNKLVAHRIVRKINSNGTVCFKTKGDFNLFLDNCILCIQNYVGLAIKISNNENKFDLESKRHKLLKYVFLLFSLLMEIKTFNKIFQYTIQNFTFFAVFSFFLGKKKRKNAKNNNSQYLYNLLLLHHQNCLDRNCNWDFTLKPLSKERFFSDLVYNKVEFLSEHMLICSSCKKNFSKKEKDFLKKVIKKQLVGSLFYQQTKSGLKNLFNKFSQDYIFFKESVFESGRNLRDFVGNDFDILVKKKTSHYFLSLLIAKGYRLKYWFKPLGLLLTKNDLAMEIDVHFSSLLPRKEIFSKNKVNILTAELFNNSKDNLLSTEYLFFTKIVGFWTNDFHKGLKPMYKIALLSELLSTSDWVRTVKLAKRYGFYNEVLTTLFVIKNFFPFIVLPNKLLPKSKTQQYKLNLTSHFFSLEKLTDFSEVKLWWDENNLQTRRFLLELHLVRTFINFPIFFSLTKPRILLLVLGLLLKKTQGYVQSKL